MVHRGIATLSGLLMACSLLLGYFEPDFFMLHFYQSLVYLMIILMLFYFEDHWAYAFGILAPALWLVLSFATGLLIARITQAPAPINLLAIASTLLGLVLIGSSAYRWKREFSGLGKGTTTFAVALVVLLVYYTALAWFYWETLTHFRKVG